MGRCTWWMALLGVGLVLIGVWGAWVPHRAAALVLSGWDLAEYVKFLPGTSTVRELFYLPVWCAGLVLAVLAVQPTIGLVTRAALIAVALGLMLAILPPYPHLLNGYQSAEFRWRFILGTCGVLLVLGFLPASRWLQSDASFTNGLAGRLLLLLALVGVFPALWQYLDIRGVIETVYGARLGWSWGVLVFVGGWVLVGGAGGRALQQFRSGLSLPADVSG